MLCDRCDRAFHDDCYIGDVEDDDGGEGQCLMCQEMPCVPRPDECRTGPRMTCSEMHVARRLLLELYAAYYPCLYFKNAENMALPPEYHKIRNPVCLGDIRDCLINDVFHTLMDLLASLRGISIMCLVRVPKKNSAARK